MFRKGGKKNPSTIGLSINKKECFFKILFWDFSNCLTRRFKTFFFPFLKHEFKMNGYLRGKKKEYRADSEKKKIKREFGFEMKLIFWIFFFLTKRCQSLQNFGNSLFNCKVDIQNIKINLVGVLIGGLIK